MDAQASENAWKVDLSRTHMVGMGPWFQVAVMELIGNLRESLDDLQKANDDLHKNKVETTKSLMRVHEELAKEREVVSERQKTIDLERAVLARALQTVEAILEKRKHGRDLVACSNACASELRQLAQKIREALS